MNPQTLNLYAYTSNDPVNRTDPNGTSWGFIGAIFGFLASFFRHTNFRFNLNFRGIPFSFGFQGHFRNIFVGVAGFNVQVTGENSVFNQLKNSWARQPGKCEIRWQLPEIGTGYETSDETKPPHRYGDYYTIQAIVGFAKSWVENEKNKNLRIGSLGIYGGGQFPPHRSRAYFRNCF